MLMSKQLLATFALITAGLLSLGTNRAFAQVVQYNTRVAFDLANPASAVSNFTNYAPSGTTYPGGVTFDGITYTGLSFPNGGSSVPEIAEGTNLGTPGNFVILSLGGQFSE